MIIDTKKGQLKNAMKHWNYSYDDKQTFTNQISVLNNP